jgi:hypothetical protein
LARVIGARPMKAPAKRSQTRRRRGTNFERPPNCNVPTQAYLPPPQIPLTSANHESAENESKNKSKSGQEWGEKKHFFFFPSIFPFLTTPPLLRICCPQPRRPRPDPQCLPSTAAAPPPPPPDPPHGPSICRAPARADLRAHCPRPLLAPSPSSSALACPLLPPPLAADGLGLRGRLGFPRLPRRRPPADSCSLPRSLRGAAARGFASSP